MQLPLTELKNGETGIIVSTDVMSKDTPMCRHRTHKGRSTDFNSHQGPMFGHHGHKGWKKKASIKLCLKRLTDLGLTPGTEVTVVKSAPFRGPLEICVRGSRLAIGRGISSRILMEVKR